MRLPLGLGLMIHCRGQAFAVAGGRRMRRPYDRLFSLYSVVSFCITLLTLVVV